ncbi:hypothetical protein [Microbacterium sp. gxy059]|uniref:hypothetical protein n=1 Tax=Microbacterium sp. gxy059 TaxID=2957199 RepID=UPI003D98420B
MAKGGQSGVGRDAPPRAAAWGDVVVLSACFAIVIAGTVVDLGLIGDGERIPVLNPTLWPAGLGVGLAGVLAAALVALAAAATGGWTKRSAAWHAVIVLLVSVVSAMALSAGFVVNPRFVDTAFVDADRLAVRLGGVVVGTLIIVGGVVVAARPFARLHRAAVRAAQ